MTYKEEFIKKNNLSEEYLDKYHILFDRYEKSLQLCVGCTGLNACRQKGIGERVAIEIDDVLLEGVEFCKYKLKEKQKENLRTSFIYSDIPEKYTNLTLKSLSLDDENIKKLVAKCITLFKENSKKGLYVCGDMGVGKTYTMMAFANNLVLEGKKVSFVKAAEFINKMRRMVLGNDENYDRMIKGIKNSEYLFIDDIGAESVSTFSRDDILFNILDYRLEHGLATYFTSNFNKEDLKEHYKNSKDGKLYEMASARLIERIDILSEDFVLVGNNKRR